MPKALRVCMRLTDYSSALKYSNGLTVELPYDFSCMTCQIIKKTKTLYKSNRIYTISGVKGCSRMVLSGIS